MPPHVESANAQLAHGKLRKSQPEILQFCPKCPPDSKNSPSLIVNRACLTAKKNGIHRVDSEQGIHVMWTVKLNFQMYIPKL